jgi:hypothetical protein
VNYDSSSALVFAAYSVGPIRSRYENYIHRLVAGGRHGYVGLSGLGLVLFAAGGFSNWIDRVLQGRVIDFLNVGIGPLRTGVFNVADMAIMLGVGLLAVDAIRWRPRSRFGGA